MLNTLTQWLAVQWPLKLVAGLLLAASVTTFSLALRSPSVVHKQPTPAPTLHNGAIDNTSTTSKANTASPASETDSPAAIPRTGNPSTPKYTDAQANALYCYSVLEPQQNSDQSNLDSTRQSYATNANGYIGQYYANHYETVDSINQFIHDGNANMQQTYQSYLSTLNTGGSNYGCNVSLTPETPLPDFSPPSAWSP